MHDRVRTSIAEHTCFPNLLVELYSQLTHAFRLCQHAAELCVIARCAAVE